MICRHFVQLPWPQMRQLTCAFMLMWFQAKLWSLLVLVSVSLVSYSLIHASHPSTFGIQQPILGWVAYII